jgi:hypothetical protein
VPTGMARVRDAVEDAVVNQLAQPLGEHGLGNI